MKEQNVSATRECIPLVLPPMKDNGLQKRKQWKNTNLLPMESPRVPRVEIQKNDILQNQEKHINLSRAPLALLSPPQGSNITNQCLLATLDLRNLRYRRNSSVKKYISHNRSNKLTHRLSKRLSIGENQALNISSEFKEISPSKHEEGQISFNVKVFKKKRLSARDMEAKGIENKFGYLYYMMEKMMDEGNEGEQSIEVKSKSRIKTIRSISRFKMKKEGNPYTHKKLPKLIEKQILRKNNPEEFLPKNNINIQFQNSILQDVTRNPKSREFTGVFSTNFLGRGKHKKGVVERGLLDPPEDKGGKRNEVHQKLRNNKFLFTSHKL